MSRGRLVAEQLGGPFKFSTSKCVTAVAQLLGIWILVLATGCSREPAAADVSAPGAKAIEASSSAHAADSAAPNLLRLAELCHTRQGEWLKGQGCGMTERLCFATYHGHGTWLKGPGCMIDRKIIGSDCTREGMSIANSFSCYVRYIPIADLQINQ